MKRILTLIAVIAAFIAAAHAQQPAYVGELPTHQRPRVVGYRVMVDSVAVDTIYVNTTWEEGEAMRMRGGRSTLSGTAYGDSAAVNGGAAMQAAGTAAAAPAPAAPKAPKIKPKLYFAWGGDAGASIDMSGNDMSSVDFDIYFGMRRGWINFLGVGVQADIAVSKSCRSFPLFLLFRTNFRNTPSRVFMELRGGASLNYLEHNHQQTGGYASGGFGIRLAEGSRFSSHMVIGYNWIQRRRFVGEEMVHNFTDLHYASVKIGVTF